MFDPVVNQCPQESDIVHDKSSGASSSIAFDQIHSVNGPNKNCTPVFTRKCSCGGLIHARFSDNNFHGLTVLFECDTCDFTWDIIEDQ